MSGSSSTPFWFTGRLHSKISMRKGCEESQKAVPEVIEIPDDDCKGVSMEELEKKSLQKAREGIIMVDSDEVLEDDGYADPQETDNGEVPEAMPKEKPMAEEREKPTIEEKPMPKEALEEPKSADDHGGTRSVDDAMKAMAEQRRKELIQQLVLLWKSIFKIRMI